MTTERKTDAPEAPALPCSIEHYSLMTPWPADGKPGQCWGYCLFHQAIRLMGNDAKRGNEEVRRVLEKLGVKS